MKSKVKIKETLERVVEVEAETHIEAEDIVKRQYLHCEHILDYDDFAGVTFNTVREHSIKTVYIIGHKGYDNFDRPRIYFLQGMTDGVFDTTYDVTKAQRFNDKEELFDYLRTYCYFDRSILFEFTEEYLDKIKDDENIKSHFCDVENY